jgi:5-methylcytosine-specific restriction endonuclease McrA
MTYPYSFPCSTCKIEKPRESFLIKKRSGESFTCRICRECRKPRPSLEKLRRVPAALARKRAKDLGLKNTLTADQWIDILSKSQGICHYCKENVGIDSLTIDHVVPFISGGDNSKENIVAACAPCNRGKSKRNGEVFIMSKLQINIRLTLEGRKLIDRLIHHFTNSDTGRKATQAEVIERAIRALANREKISEKS